MVLVAAHPAVLSVCLCIGRNPVGVGVLHPIFPGLRQPWADGLNPFGIWSEVLPFATIVYAHQQHVSIGRCVGDLEIIALASAPDEATGQIVHLPL